MQTIHAPRVAPLDPNRIAAISGAIAINGLLLALLVAPMSAPVVVETARQVFVDVIPPKPHAVQPPPKQPPIHVRIEQPHTTPAPTRPVTRQVEPPPLANTDPQAGDPVVPPADEHARMRDGDRVVGPPDDGRPMEGAHLEYASNPAPTYPRDALAHGETGTVVLQVLVGVDGRPIEVTISRSSGHRSLDIAAKRQVLANWSFKPAMRNGQPVQAIGLVPVEFSLQ